MSNTLKPVEAQLKAYNSRDIDDFVQHFAVDCTCEDSEGNILLSGREAMYELYKKMFEASPELHCNIVSRTVVGNFVFDEERVTGRAGNTGEMHVMAVYTVENEIIKRVRFFR